MSEINLAEIQADISELRGFVHDSVVLQAQQDKFELEKRLTAIEKKLDAIDSSVASIEADTL